MDRTDENHLKDMVFRGAFFVILVYVLVFLYNSGLLDRLRKNPSPKPSPTPSANIKTQDAVESTPSEMLEYRYENQE